MAEREVETGRREAEPERDDPVRYPVDHVVAILDTREEVECALGALTPGFFEFEVRVACGAEEAERLHASTGHTGLLDRVLRVAEHIGIPNDELETKERYEQALREGKKLLMVHAPTEERKQRAGEAIRGCGGHFINFLGRFTREVLAA
jgi:hypothetical protein